GELLLESVRTHAGEGKVSRLSVPRDDDLASGVDGDRGSVVLRRAAVIGRPDNRLLRDLHCKRFVCPLESAVEGADERETDGVGGSVGCGLSDKIDGIFAVNGDTPN